MNADPDPATQINADPDPDKENKNLMSSCKFFSILAHETLDPDPESGFAIRKNAVSGSGSATLEPPGSRPGDVAPVGAAWRPGGRLSFQRVQVSTETVVFLNF